MDPNEYGDEIILHLASNLLEVEIILIPAFRESGCDPVRGITKIQPLLEPRNDPFYFFAYSDSDFHVYGWNLVLLYQTGLVRRLYFSYQTGLVRSKYSLLTRPVWYSSTRFHP